MSRLFTKRFFVNCYRGSAAGSALLAIVVFVWGIVLAFAADKTIQVDMHHRRDAVAITRVTLADADVQCGLVVSSSELQPVTPVAASGDWLQDVTIYLLNRTNKTIVFGQIALVFPETGTGSPNSPIREYLISFGRLPPAAAFSGRTGQPIVQPPNVRPALFAAGQILPIHVSEHIDRIKATVDLNAVSKVVIRRKAFFFADGMKWDGEYSTPNAERPGKFNRLEPSYFPGTPTWPPRAHN